jgi:hypothetical protein
MALGAGQKPRWALQAGQGGGVRPDQGLHVGNIWWIQTRIQDLRPEQVERRSGQQQ